MCEQDGIWCLTIKPRRGLRWLPIEKIDDWLIGKAKFVYDGKGVLPRPPNWYMVWNDCVMTLDWEWEPIEDD